MVWDIEGQTEPALPRPPPSTGLLESGKVMIENLAREQYDICFGKTSSPSPRAASTI
jgi:hypothetical protein